MSKTLILVRHAHRDTDAGKSRDNGLSPRGKKQAQKVADFFHGRFPEESPLLVSSPKRRCIETLAPIVDGREDKVHIDKLLDEEGELESKAHKFIDWWVNIATDLVVACSHGDWLPVAIKQLTGAQVEMKKGAWIEIRREDDENYLEWLVQRL